jgi:uridylate kinase
MAEPPRPHRVLLKLSGSSFTARDGGVFHEEALDYLVGELREAAEGGPQMAVVVGGGNVIRGARFCPTGLGRIHADYAGMLATAVNALILRDRLQRAGLEASHYGAFPIPRMMPPFEPEPCIADLEAGALVLLAGGTGSPLFTTDTAAALRAVELEADVLLKATRVDGIYSADPERSPDAELYDRISYREVLERKLGVMDLTAVSFCLQHSLPVRVFNYGVAGNIRRAAAGEDIGTLIGG